MVNQNFRFEITTNEIFEQNEAKEAQQVPWFARHKYLIVLALSVLATLLCTLVWLSSVRTSDADTITSECKLMDRSELERVLKAHEPKRVHSEDLQILVKAQSYIELLESEEKRFIPLQLVAANHALGSEKMPRSLALEYDCANFQMDIKKVDPKYSLVENDQRTYFLGRSLGAANASPSSNSNNFIVIDSSNHIEVVPEAMEKFRGLNRVAYEIGFNVDKNRYECSGREIRMDCFRFMANGIRETLPFARLVFAHLQLELDGDEQRVERNEFTKSPAPGGCGLS